MRIITLLLLCSLMAFAADPTDRSAVHSAAKDYIDALYEVRPDLIERSVHPNLSKRGFYRNEQGVYQEGVMTYQQLVNLAGRWNKDGKRDLSKSPREVVVTEVLDQTATAKVIADWGIDYMQLGKFNGQWKIVNILWQSHPPKK
ncbi:MAG: nuclear transport factor 2 family protein [Bryobacterales bacterium]|nr:nuclear transport factor 2 family protein [Bryobacterales bacterium]